MINEPKAAANVDKALAELAQLRQFTGAPNAFWPRYLTALQQLTQCDKLVLLARKPGADAWRRLLDWPSDSPPSRMLTTFATQLDAFASRAAESGALLAPLEARTGPAAGNFMLAARLDLPQPEQCLLAALVSEVSENAARETLLRLRLAVQVPEAYQANLVARQAKSDLDKFASVLDLAVLVNSERKFLAAALAFCNGVATRFNCDRVSLGWRERGYVRLRAVSRTEKFDRQMAAAQALEVAMEEALDQDEEVVWPVPGAGSSAGASPPSAASTAVGLQPAVEGSVITRDHERFAKDQKVAHLCSLPLRANQEAVAVLTCEREAAAFSQAELQQLRLGCDVAAVRLADLHGQDRWFGARWTAHLRQECAKLVGPEHTWAKLLAVLIAVLLAVLVFLRVPYRVEGNFVLRSDELTYLTAPFEGYIDQVLVRPGDTVAAGKPLLKLKTAELELEESYALADLNRFQREAEKARAAHALADMRISEAMAEQAKARMEMVQYRIAHATVASPFDGVVVEGDLRERLGSPVKTAEVLFKVARIDTLYAEAEVNERDIHEILNKSTGDIAFVSRPKYKFPIRITTVEQAAVSKNDANVFLVRCQLAERPQPWWRPGMSGVCKINVEKRTLLWILTHRTVDFLRLKLWW